MFVRWRKGLGGGSIVYRLVGFWEGSVRFSTGRVTTFVRKRVVKSRGTAMRAFTGVRRKVPKTVSFLSGPGCAPCVCRARSDIMLIGGSFAPRRRVGTALVGMSGTCRDLTGLLGLCRVDGPGGRKVSSLTFITPDTGVNRGMCVNTFTCVNRGTIVKSGARVCPRAFIKSNMGVNGNYLLCSGMGICRSYHVNGRYVLRSNTMVKTSKFKFTPAPGKCSGVPRVKVIVLRSGMSVNTGAYISQTAVKTAIVRDNTGVSGLMRVTRGSRIKSRAMVTTRINVTNSAGVNR